ncbi:aminotransferase class V-fold PLP-dependent enzyme [Aureimonas ureilytica]|uniref:aminotransferase class V-fold PLP-dependent enzyme n=1 Tax=Aureimonas ureilytica TaxID=401562 RepID=UPI0003635A97|nr:aminotransferase class V-fold PLP-dependent enzyme [Aureimonas ureilytica]
MSGYFLYHSIGTFPGKAEALRGALGRFADDWSAENDAQWPTMLSLRARFIETWAGLIDAPAGSLTTTESVTAGLYALIGALPRERLAGRRVLVAADGFPSLHFLLQGLAPRFGFTLDTVPLRPGERWVRDEDMLAAWGPDVGLALLTFVTSTASHRCDMGALAAHGREMGSLTVADVTQGIGIRPFSVADGAIDAVVSTSLKWLCGVSGAGVLQVRPDLLATCRPEFRGWFSQENPFSWDLDAFRFAPDARRFDQGTPSILPAAGSLPGLDHIRSLGLRTVAAQNARLTERIVAMADEAGLPLASPREADRRGGSVMLNLGDAAAGLVGPLRARGLFCDARGPVLRLSPGLVTQEADVDRLFSAFEDLGARRAAA